MFKFQLLIFLLQEKQDTGWDTDPQLKQGNLETLWPVPGKGLGRWLDAWQHTSKIHLSDKATNVSKIAALSTTLGRRGSTRFFITSSLCSILLIPNISINYNGSNSGDGKAKWQSRTHVSCIKDKSVMFPCSIKIFKRPEFISGFSSGFCLSNYW